MFLQMCLNTHEVLRYQMLECFLSRARILAIVYLCVYYSHCYRSVHIMSPLIHHHSKGDSIQADLRYIGLLRKDLFNK